MDDVTATENATPYYTVDISTASSPGLGDAVESDGYDGLPNPMEEVVCSARIWEGYGVYEAQEVIGILNKADIPARVVGVTALQYYGAGRVADKGDIRVLDYQLAEAETIIKENAQYEPAKSPSPAYMTFRHLNPAYRRKDALFTFILAPSEDCFINPRCEFSELSRHGIPYPKMEHFARALLVLGNDADIADFIDGMDLDEEWGASHIGFDDLQVKGVAWAEVRNDELEVMGQVRSFSTDGDYRKHQDRIAGEKERCIEPMKKGSYKTQWRSIRNDWDPRLRDGTT